MSRRFTFFLSALLAFAAVSWAQDNAAEHPDRVELEKQSAAYPELPASNLADVVSIRMEKNDLAVFTRLQPTNGPARVKLKDLAGLNRVNIHMQPGVNPPPLYTPDVFSFEHFDFSRPGITDSINVQVTGWNVQVSQVMEGPTEIKSISLVQTPPDATDDNVGIRLVVKVQGNSGDAPSINIERSAVDFVALRRQFPRDTSTYLEPIFRALHADGTIFGTDRKLAWQVFAAQANPDPAVDEKVKKIIVRLDADDFHDRESAAADLNKLGEPAAISLWRMSRAGLTPEQIGRIDAFLSTYQPASSEDAKRLGRDVNFLLDCLYDTDEFLVRCALTRVQEITGHQIAFDTTLRDEPRRAAVAKLRDTLAPTSALPATQPASSEKHNQINLPPSAN